MTAQFSNKQQAFNFFEQKRREALEYSRWVAKKLVAKNGNVTIDDVRDHVTLPEGINNKLFGAVFADKNDWELTGYTKTRRGTSHGRVIGIYRYIGTKPYKLDYSNASQMALI